MTFDKDLATQNKQRTQVIDMVQTEDGRFIHVYREKIVKMPKVSKEKVTKIAKAPRAPKVKGQPSKKELAIQLYMASSHLPRQELVKLFMDNLSMSKAGATTYVYNVMKTV